MGVLDRLIVATMPVVPKFLVHKVASRYVAGETLADALEVLRQLQSEGAMATLDVLGEEVFERDKAVASVEQYLRALDGIAEHGLPSNISVKPTMLGLKIDPAFLEENLARLAEGALRHGNFMRIDMEDRSTTDATLQVYRNLQERYGNVGVVLQAYMRRTLDDIDELPAEKPNVRLCKGIYIEPRQDAWKGFETVRRAFVAALDKLFRKGIYVGIATHDEYLVAAACELIDRHGLGREDYEFQMLLGVDPELRRILLAQGHRLRVYVPYGRDWYPYSIRRLRENPEVAGHVFRAMLSGN